MEELNYSLLSNRYYGEKTTRISLRDFADKVLSDPNFEGFLGNLKDGSIKNPDSLRNFKKKLAKNDIPKNWISANKIRRTFSESD